MKFFYLFSVLLLVFTIVSCDSSSSNDRKNPPPVYELTTNDIDAITDELKESREITREKRKLDSNFVMICQHCTARTNDEVKICDSCGLSLPEDGPRLVTIKQINAMEITYCASCGKLIPEDAVACKYCMGIQPINE